jgi:hypothetical protein
MAPPPLAVVLREVGLLYANVALGQPPDDMPENALDEITRSLQELFRRHRSLLPPPGTPAPRRRRRHR